MNVLVSVIIPMYNCEAFIEKCVRSLLDQVYKYLEIIVVDDGSTDSGAQIVKDLSNEDDRIRYISQKNAGPGAARNHAIREANGKYILFVDADDYLATDYIDEMVRYAEKNQAELTVAGYTVVYCDREKERKIIPQYYVKDTSEEWVYRISACCGRLYLKKFWDDSKLKFNEVKEARAEDVPIALYTNAMAKNITIVKNAGYFYLQHQNSAMNSKHRRVLFEFPYDAFSDIYKKIRKRNIENSKAFFDFGVLKFLAQFDWVIYQKAYRNEKEYFRKKNLDVIGEDFREIVTNWNQIKNKISLPLTHRAAIDLLIVKYRFILARSGYGK